MTYDNPLCPESRNSSKLDQTKYAPITVRIKSVLGQVGLPRLALRMEHLLSRTMLRDTRDSEFLAQSQRSADHLDLARTDLTKYAPITKNFIAVKLFLSLMHTYISFLRGINVGGKKKMTMNALKDLYRSLGFKNSTAYIQSGNIIFQSSQADTSLLSQKIEHKIQKAFGFQTAVIIRTIPEMKQIIEENPFVQKQHENITTLFVAFLSEKPARTAIDGLKNIKTDGEEWFFHRKELYLFIPGSSGRAKLSNTFLEKKLAVKSTIRNWNTILKITEMAGAVALQALK